MTTTIALADLDDLIGKPLPPGEWVHVDQKRIDTFADAADDPQWIHTDPVRAADGPFGTTIAHGYLTLALVIPLFEKVLDVTGVTTKINYGLDKVRFPAPVPVDSRVRINVTVAEVTDLPAGRQLSFDAVVEVEGQAKPACIARPVFRFLS
ncbi:MaoC family dehydratase [Millisia brevis]|uniref:MaoC family dehydratase n=1 Tax=Millisia brevis TaxID=264148 RepID=UPI00082A5271|nr:MaoC family dehydratase [Millisia brevis]